jgi:Integrase core domain
MMESTFRDIYYRPENYWHGKVAVKKLAEASGYSESECKTWLDKQVIYQIYLPKPHRIIRPKFNVTIPNQIHQADLLFLPHDNVNGVTYRYALTVIDIASRYKAAYPLTTKNSDDVARAIENIYSLMGGLTFPKSICVDAGSEFKGEFTKLMTRHNVSVDRAVAGGAGHRKQALVERFNRTLAEKLFTVQYAKDILKEARGEKDVRSREWVNDLQSTVAVLNNTYTRMIKMTPNEAIKLDEVKLPIHVKREKKIDLADDQKVRYLLEPGEIENDTRRRATDPIWSLDMYDIAESTKIGEEPYMYKLDVQDPAAAKYFVKEELLIVPAQSELPPDSIL